jgi:hypothetical protein
LGTMLGAAAPAVPASHAGHRPWGAGARFAAFPAGGRWRIRSSCGSMRRRRGDTRLPLPGSVTTRAAPATPSSILVVSLMRPPFSPCPSLDQIVSTSDMLSVATLRSFTTRRGRRSAPAEQPSRSGKRSVMWGLARRELGLSSRPYPPIPSSAFRPGDACGCAFSAALGCPCRNSPGSRVSNRGSARWGRPLDPYGDVAQNQGDHGHQHRHYAVLAAVAKVAPRGGGGSCGRA